MTRLTTRIAAGFGALLLGASMTACTGRASTAAVVGGQRITVQEIDEYAAGLPEELRTSAPALTHPSFVLSTRMRALAAQQIAAQNGIPNLRAETERMLAGEQISPIIQNDPEARMLLVETNEVNVLAERLNPEAVNAAFARMPVEVNPRYGITGLEPVGVSQTDPVPQLRNPSLSRPAGGPA